MSHALQPLYTPSERQSEEPSVTPAADCPTPRAHVLFHCSNRQALLQKLTMASRWQAAQTTRAPALKALNAAMRGLLALAAPHVKGGFTKVHFYSRGSSPSPSRSRVDRSVVMITRHSLAFRVSGTGPGSPHDHERCCHYQGAQPSTDVTHVLGCRPRAAGAVICVAASLMRHLEVLRGSGWACSAHLKLPSSCYRMLAGELAPATEPTLACSRTITRYGSRMDGEVPRVASDAIYTAFGHAQAPDLRGSLSYGRFLGARPKSRFRNLCR